ncbi:MAG: PDZ domain-containing protein [Desulfarculus sp.]|nr:MAG: PDZ domain-containing protein [Desulfarculus sp.]
MPAAGKFLLLACLALAAGCAALTPAPPPAPAPGVVLAPPGQAPLNQAQMERRLEQTQVLLVGESHDDPGHHEIQLRLLRLMSRGRPLVLGVEWLDHSAQPACDQLSAGQISVEEFARRANWEAQWGFPLRLYAPILEEVRRRGLRLVALNAPLAVVRQVARGGLKSLTRAQRAELAPALDLSDPAYRASVSRQFADHGVGSPQAQENFFAAQVARDDTMAFHLARALEPWPDSGQRAVVLVGGGHLSHGLGLPPRIARRLPGVRMLSVLPVSGRAAAFLAGRPEGWPADLVVVSAPAPPGPPRLGVLLKKEPGGLRVVRVLPGSPAQKAGLGDGDLLLAVDGRPLTSPKGIHDAIKAAPFAPHRYRLRRGARELELVIRLERPETAP